MRRQPLGLLVVSLLAGAGPSAARAGPPAAEADPLTARRQHLERLRTALWQFAALHQGRFPRGDETGEMPADLWTVPGGGGLRYQYIAGLSASQRPALLAAEPELDP